jgi:D-alanyl-D-alanine carboxypeptidase
MYGTNVSTLATTVLPSDQQAAALAGTLRPGDYTDTNPSWGWAAGAAISTAEDLKTYVEALVGGGLLDADLQQQRLDSVTSVRPGDPTGPGYGLALASFGPMLGHNGALPGFQSFMGHDPVQDTTLIVLANLQFAPDGAEPADAIARRILELLSSTTTAAPDTESKGHGQR